MCVCVFHVCIFMYVCVLDAFMYELFSIYGCVSLIMCVSVHLCFLCICLCVLWIPVYFVHLFVRILCTYMFFSSACVHFSVTVYFVDLLMYILGTYVFVHLLVHILCTCNFLHQLVSF